MQLRAYNFIALSLNKKRKIKYMKKIIYIILATIIVCGFIGCGRSNEITSFLQYNNNYCEQVYYRTCSA